MAGVSRVTEWQQSISKIRDPGDHPDEPPLIAQLYASCSDLFRDIIAGLSGDALVDKSVLISLQRSQSYMVLWADGYGVSDGLLDKTLDKSRRARSTTLRLIFSVSQTLTKRLALHATQEHRDRWVTRITEIGVTADKIKFMIEHDDTGDSDSDTSSDTSSQAGTNDLEEIAEDLLTDTQCLMDLGSRFQEDHVGPVNIESAASAAQLSTWDPSMNFVDRIRWRYPHCKTALAERLGKANWDRVLRHREIVSENSRPELAVATPEYSTPAKQAPSQVASTNFRDSALGSSAPSGVVAFGHMPTEYAETMVSYRTGQGDSIRVPPLPDGARQGKPFSCIGCGLKVNVKTKSAWKKHLFLDLQPYICLHDGCDFNSTPFPTKTQWEYHVSLEHGPPQSTATTSECPICQENASDWVANANIHLARHLEEIALTVLPTNLDSEDGTDLDSGLASSETSIKDSPAFVGQGSSAQSGASDRRATIRARNRFLIRSVRQSEVPGEELGYFYDDGTHCKTTIDGEPVNAHWGVTKAGKPRKRLAIACLTCRELKIKCYPDYPRCVQCQKFGRTCRYKNVPRENAQVAQETRGDTVSLEGMADESKPDTSTVATGAGWVTPVGDGINQVDSPNQPPQRLPSLSSIFGPPKQIRPLQPPGSERPSLTNSPLDRPHPPAANPDESLSHDGTSPLRTPKEATGPTGNTYSLTQVPNMMPSKAYHTALSHEFSGTSPAITEENSKEHSNKNIPRNDTVKEKGKIHRTMADIYGDELYSPSFSIGQDTPKPAGHTATPPSNELFTQRLQAANHQHLVSPTSSPSLSPFRHFRHGSPLAPVLDDSTQSELPNPVPDILPEFQAILNAGMSTYNRGKVADISDPDNSLIYAPNIMGATNLPSFPPLLQDSNFDWSNAVTPEDLGLQNLPGFADGAETVDLAPDGDYVHSPPTHSLNAAQHFRHMQPSPIPIADSSLGYEGSNEGRDSFLNAKPGRKGLQSSYPAATSAKETQTSHNITMPKDTKEARPWKCPIPTCRYYEYGWPTEKEMDRHINDKHSATPFMYECLYKPCPYTSKRESNRKRHMAKAHGWKPDSSKPHPFHCSLGNCAATPLGFYYKKDREQHMLTHHPEAQQE